MATHEAYGEVFNDLFEFFEKIVYENDVEKFAEVLETLEDINIQNSYGWTLLHITIRRDRREMVELLLDKGADIDRVDGVGWTPLMEAVMDDMPELCQLLVDRGADKSISNARGVTASALAHKFGRVNMYEILG